MQAASPFTQKLGHGRVLAMWLYKLNLRIFRPCREKSDPYFLVGIVKNPTVPLRA